MDETAIPRELEDALTNLEHFSLIASNNGHLHVTAQLFLSWVQRKINL
jgi:hypothetical protein